MIATAENTATKYRVEVSGWDAHKSFFVENSDLDWGDASGKRVTLSHALSDGSVVFLRLLQPMTGEKAHPVPYEAEFVARTETGLRQFRLRPVGSRSARHVDPERGIDRVRDMALFR